MRLSNFKKRKKFILATLLLVSLFIVNNAYAAQQTSTLVAASVNGKALTLTAPASVKINDIEVSSDSTETDGAMTGIQIVDLRGKKVPLGWSLTATATDFTTLTSDRILVTEFSAEVSTYKFVRGTDGGIVIPGKVQFLDSNSDGTSDAATLVYAKQGFGAGRFVIDPILRLIVPSFSIAGTYSSTITLTLA